MGSCQRLSGPVFEVHVEADAVFDLTLEDSTGAVVPPTGVTEATLVLTTTESVIRAAAVVVIAVATLLAARSSGARVASR